MNGKKVKGKSQNSIRKIQGKIQPKGRNEIHKYRFKLFQTTIRKFHRILDEAEQEIWLSKKCDSMSCGEYKDFKAWLQEYQ